MRAKTSDEDERHHQDQRDDENIVLASPPRLGGEFTLHLPVLFPR